MDNRQSQSQLALAMAVALLLAGLLLLADRWYIDQARMRADMQIEAEVIGANAVAAMTFDDLIAAEEIVNTASRIPGMLEAALYRADGSRLAHFLRAGVVSDLAERTFVEGSDVSWNDLAVEAPIKLNERKIGSIRLRVETKSLYLGLGRFSVGLLMIAAISLLFGRIASRKIRRRIAEAEAALQHMALVDRVTGLCNRYAFEHELARVVALHGRDGLGSALLFIDVDNFKKVNDLYGHQNGDGVLREIADRLRGSLRRGDVIARIGGDEFAVILVNTHEPRAIAHIAATLNEVAARPFMIDDVPVHVGFSIGIAIIPDDGDSAERLLNDADLAMYQAKQAGKGSYEFFSPQFGAKVYQRNQIEVALRHAVSRDELEVVYQPQVDLCSGEMIGLEALVRWRRPEVGLVSPDEFISVAEESGLIVEIGRAILARVCRDIRDLRDEGWLVPSVAVNVSARQLRMGDFRLDCERTLAEFGLQPCDIELELTESVLMDRIESQRDFLDRLLESGFRIAIDDFGTGYSSLSYLRHLKADKLKIDRSFIQTLPDDADSVAITAAIIDMAHAIGLKVLAEGVENDAQLACLQANACDYIQGYKIGKPMVIDELRAFLKPASRSAS